MSLNVQQFHEMTRDEFEALPGTYFHGNPTGNFNWEHPRSPYGFHVGTKRAAEDAVNARAAHGVYSDGSSIPAPLKAREIVTPTGHVMQNGVEMKEVRHETHPEAVRGGRIVSPMVNGPQRAEGYRNPWRGDMTHSGDVKANAKAREITSKGQTMRRGIYYENVSEDEGSISAVLPSRQSWRTHEDYLVDARRRGVRISHRALTGYTEIPGQQRLF